MKLTDDYAAGNTDAHKSPVDERYGLIATVRRSLLSQSIGGLPPDIWIWVVSIGPKFVLVHV